MSAGFFFDIYSIVCLVVFLISQWLVKRPIQMLYRGLKVGVEKILLFKLSVQVSESFCSDCQ